MADVELVIKLSEKNCEYIKRFGTLWIESENGASIILKAILDGTILPKGHGRLIDADAYRKDMQVSREFNFFATLDLQPTIIESAYNI